MIRITKKKRNPKNEKLLKQLIIKKEKLGDHPLNENIVYKIKHGGKFIAEVHVNLKHNFIDDIFMDPVYQRQGLGTFIYDYIEKDQNIKLKPSEYLSSKGEAFWKTRLRKSLLQTLNNRYD